MSGPARDDDNVVREVLLPAVDSDEGRAALLREARALARIGHPNVRAVIDVVLEGGDVVLLVPHVPGRRAQVWQATAAPTSRQIIDVYQQAARGLGAAHRLGIAHGDVRPEAVLVGDDGRVHVVEFALAAAAATATGHRSRMADQAALARCVRDALAPSSLDAPIVAALDRAQHPDPESRWETIEIFAAQLGATLALPAVAPLVPRYIAPLPVLPHAGRLHAIIGVSIVAALFVLGLWYATRF